MTSKDIKSGDTHGGDSNVDQGGKVAKSKQGKNNGGEKGAWR